MKLVDANLLLFAVDSSSRWHHRAAWWWTTQLEEATRVGVPWQSLGAFVRIATNPRVFDRPLEPSVAWAHVEAWLARDNVWVPQPTVRHAEVLGALVSTHQPRGNLFTDVQLAALAIEHGLTVCSADTDFARFTEIRWENPLA